MLSLIAGNWSVSACSGAISITHPTNLSEEGGVDIILFTYNSVFSAQVRHYWLKKKCCGGSGYSLLQGTILMCLEVWENLWSAYWIIIIIIIIIIVQLWSASELYQPSDRRLSAKLVPTFADRGLSRGRRGGSLRP
jgi:hypothetical protein